jgi:DNA repair exonuclease SbcCD nuclease subunit
VLEVAYRGVRKILQKSTVDMMFTFLVGNHDTDSKNKRTHSLSWLNAFGPRVRVVNQYFHSAIAGCSFLSYTESKEEMATFFGLSQETCFMHQGIADVPMGSGFLINELFDLDMIPEHVSHVYTGHYHEHKRVSDRATVIGSPMQLNWSDEGIDKGFLIVDTKTGNVEQVLVDSPRFVTYNMTNSLREGRQIQEPIEGNFVRVINYDETHKEDIRNEFINRGSRSVEFVTKKVDAKLIKPAAERAEFHLPTLVQQYEKDTNITEDRIKVGREIMK